MHTIWKDLNVSLDDINEMSADTMTGVLGIEFTEIAKDHLRASMPVDARTKQPYGILHGGASAALVETLGSIASSLVIDKKTQYCVGISLNINHLRAAVAGQVHGVARPLHVGRSTHVWDVRIYNDQDKMTAVGRLTVAVLERAEMADREKKFKSPEKS